ADSGAGVSPAPGGEADGWKWLALTRSLGRRDPSSVAVLRRVDACPTLNPPRLTVPRDGRWTVQALHEPERRPPARHQPSTLFCDRAGPEDGAPIPQFMVPMRGVHFRLLLVQ